MKNSNLNKPSSASDLTSLPHQPEGSHSGAHLCQVSKDSKSQLSLPHKPASLALASLRPARANLLYLAVSLLTLGLLLTACDDDTVLHAPTSRVAGGSPVKLTVFAPQRSDQDLATNSFTREISQKFNIQFTWQTTTYDGALATQKRRLSLTSGDYPDLYLLIPWIDQFSQAELLRYSQEGLVIPLNELIKLYAPNIQTALDKNPDYKAMATAPDGKIYGLPQWVDCFHCSYQDKLWINSTWLKKLGLAMPTTTAEMKAVLTAFKTRDPNSNGKADEVPLSADVRDNLIPFFMNAFIYDPQGANVTNNSTLVLNDGKVDIQANKEGWKQGLAYLKSLFDAGLIDQDAFTQSPDELKKLGDHPNNIILGSATVLHPAIFFTLGGPDGRDRQYDPVPPLKGPDGARYTGYTFPSAPGATFVLTNKASKEAQVAAIKMLDYIFTTEGEIHGMFGNDERTVIKPGPNDIALEQGVTPLYKQIVIPAGTSPYNNNWGPLAQYNNTKEFRGAEAIPNDIYEPSGYERRLNEATKLYAGYEDKTQIYPYWLVWIEPALGGEVATLQNNLEKYIDDYNFKFIVGIRSLDKDWDSYLNGFDQLGLKRYLEIEQQAYDRSSYKK